MNFPGPGLYTEREEAVAVSRGEYLKSVRESRDEWCGAVDPTGPHVCQLPAGHTGRHDWQRWPAAR